VYNEVKHSSLVFEAIRIEYYLSGYIKWLLLLVVVLSLTDLYNLFWFTEIVESSGLAYDLGTSKERPSPILVVKRNIF